MKSREGYRPQPLGVNATFTVKGQYLGGFLPTVSGTLSVVENASGVTVVNAVPVTAGVFLRLALMFSNAEGGVVTLAGGAAGTLLL